MLSISSYILVYKYWWFCCSSRHNSICHQTILCCYNIFRGYFKYNNAWDGWFEYLTGWSTLWTPSMSPTWPCFVASIVIPSSVWCDLLLQRIYFIIPVRNVTLASSSSEELKFRLLGLVPPSVASAAPEVSPGVTDPAQTTGTIIQTCTSYNNTWVFL